MLIGQQPGPDLETPTIGNRVHLATQLVKKTGTVPRAFSQHRA
jgi:hypothetical protein